MEADGNAFVCRVNERDHPLLSSSVLKEIGKKTEKAVSLDDLPLKIVGGVNVLRKDLRVFYDNSLEAIFERNREHMRCIAAACIFGEASR